MEQESGPSGQVVNVPTLGVDWCVAIQLIQSDKEKIFLNVHPPCECRDHVESFMNHMAFMSSFLINEQFTNVFTVGDFNCHISDHGSVFANHLNH